MAAGGSIGGRWWSLVVAGGSIGGRWWLNLFDVAPMPCTVFLFPLDHYRPDRSRGFP